MLMLNINQNFTIRDSGNVTYRKTGAHILKKTEILVITYSDKIENVVWKSKVLWFY